MTVFTDLDSTLIYSHRHETEEPFIWVERIEDKLQSYMTEKTYRFFREQRFPVVPVTTRRVAQYLRLQETAGLMGWHHALVCNGSILLCDGVEDPEWSEASRAYAAADLPAFYEALDYVHTVIPEEDIVCVEPFMFFAKPREHQTLLAELRERCEPAHVSLFGDPYRVYVLPASLNKGTAIRRYLERFGEDLCVAAGDSEFDIPMLNEADVSFYPEILADDTAPRDGHCIRTEPFSDGLCDALAELEMRNKC